METNYKRLTRSTSERKIAGVCGGIASFLNIDPAIVRILFLIALICGSLGFWIYLIVWICTPEDNAIE